MEKSLTLDQARASDVLVEPSEPGEFVNASGHKQELERNFRLINICGLGVTAGNTWLALGGSLIIAIYNGGPPGVIYEFLAASVFYWLVAASIAELSSTMPSSGGVYHWASVTGGNYGRMLGFFAGYWNFLAWILAVASSSEITGAQAVSMYALYHPDFETQRWQVFIGYLITVWGCCLVVLWANRALPTLETIGGFLVVACAVVTIIVCAVMPYVNGIEYASSAFVWGEWQNETGYESNGLVFCLGMLNGAFAVGTPDVLSHIAEEVPEPGKNIPKAILAQYIIGFFSALLYLIAMFYGINDLTAVLESPYLFPLTEIYRQATGTVAGALGLLIVALIPNLLVTMGCFITSSRIFWTLARDNAVPFPAFFSRIHPTHRNPANSIVICAIITTLLGCIYVASETAFSAFVGSFILFTTLSYLAAILPHLLSGRKRVRPGWFWMKGWVGYAVNTVGCAYMVVFDVLFCFPFASTFDAASMNYTSLIVGGFTLFIAAFWLWRRHEYEGPKFVPLESTELTEGVITTEARLGEVCGKEDVS